MKPEFIHDRRNGQALIAATLSLIFMFGVIGLSVDLGWGYYLKSRVQTAADSAASAAAVYAMNNGDACAALGTCGVVYTCAGVSPPTTSLQAGCLYATSDGPPVMLATMIENDSTTPPSGVSGNTAGMWIRATVSTSAPNLFLYSSGYHTASIASQATAGVTTVPAPGCMYVLAPTGQKTLEVSGSGVINASNCGVYVNSNNSTALVVSGSGNITANTIKVVGSTSGTTSPTPITGASPVADPLINLPAPIFSGCDHTGFSYSSAADTSLDPGVYCNGITLSSKGHVTLNPGIYILDGGGLTISQGGTVTGNHVMFYNTATGSHTIKPITLSGSANLTLVAPNSGTWKGIAFFQDRSKTYTSDNVVSGSSIANVTGTWYFPTTSVNFSGGSTSPQTTAFVAYTVTVSGGASMVQDTTGTMTGLAKSTASLIQ